jgi:hypothetical protein
MSIASASSASADVTFAFPPFYAIVETGLKRMLDFVKSDCFTFVVNGEHFESTVSEAILISPTVCDLLRRDAGTRSFIISSSDIESNDFSLILGFVRLFDTILSKDRIFPLLLIFNILGNDQLSFLLLASMNLSNSKTLMERIEPKAVIPCLTIRQDILSSDTNIEYCASKFSLYSIDTLRCLSRNVIHTLLSSESLRLENEDLLLRTLLELGKDYLEYLKYVEFIFLSQEGITLFVDNLPICELTSDLWSKIVSRLKGDSDETFRHRRISSEGQRRIITFESTIVSTNPTIFQEFEMKQWQLLYRGSRDGFESTDFHQKVDGHSNTLTFVETTKGFIFGGYMPCSFASSGGWKGDDSLKSFLFTLKNPHNIPAHKFPLKADKCQYTLYCNSSHNLLWFGSGGGIGILTGCNSTNNSHNQGFGKTDSSYVNDTNINGETLFTGESTFTVKELEVFELVD